MDTLLEVRDLVVNFDVFEGELKVIDGINLSIKEGEVIGIVGETGCGKSVTMKTILGLLPKPPGRIVKGNILFRSRDMLEMNENQFNVLRRKEMRLIPQSVMTSLNPTFTIGDWLTDVVYHQSIKETRASLGIFQSPSKTERSEIEARLTKMLEDVYIPSPENVLKSYPFQLSGGMRQRILIVAALSGNPSLVVADEPGTALDVTTHNSILSLLQKKVSELSLSVLYVTHNLAVANKICHRINIMYAGNVVEAANSDVIFVDPQHPYTKGLISSLPTLLKRTITGIPGRVPNYLNPPMGCRFHPRCPYRKDVCSKSKPDLLECKGDHLVACHAT